MSPSYQQDLPPAEIRAQLDRVLGSAEFTRSSQMREFLQFVVEETLAGREDRLKQYTIATNVFGRSTDFDPQSDPVVRMLAGKIRRALHRYYLEDGRGDAIRFDIPKGGYVPRFHPAETSAVEREPESRQATEIRPVVGVLPFFDYSTDTSKPFLAESVAEEIATELARFKYFRVIAYYSSRQYKESENSLASIGAELGCDYLVTGSVNLGSGHIRLNTQLISVSTEFQVWSRRWVTPYSPEDLFSVMDQLVAQVVGRVADNQGVILRYAAKAAAAKTVKEPSLYETILRFQGYANTITLEEYQAVKAELERGVAASPKYGMAWACLGLMYLDSILFDFPCNEDARERARACVKRAVSLDPTCQQAYFTMATQCLLDGDRRGVSIAADKIYQINPAAAYMVGSAGWFLTLIGEEERGFAMMEEALELNPHQPPWFHFAHVLAALRRQDFREASKWAQRFEMPDFAWSPLCQASTSALAGDQSLAESAADALIQLKPDIESKAEELIGHYVLDQDLRGLLLQGLEMAGLQVSRTG